MELQIKRLIEEQGTSIKEVADKMGISLQYASNTFRGSQNASIKFYERIADTLGVPLWRLFCPEEDDPVTQAKNKSITEG